MRLATWVVPVALLIAAAPLPARAQGLSEIETDDLRLLYRDPSQAYLVPHAGRCFENSMRFQRWLFDYVPSQRVSVLLNDYSDAGNASAMGTPHNVLMLESNLHMNTMMLSHMFRPGGRLGLWWPYLVIQERLNQMPCRSCTVPVMLLVVPDRIVTEYTSLAYPCSISELFVHCAFCQTSELLTSGDPPSSSIPPKVFQT